MSGQLKIAKPASKASKAIAQIQRKQKQNGQLAKAAPSKMGFVQQIAAGKLASAESVQAKLKLGAPNDRFEKEADTMADQVMRKAEPAVDLGKSGEQKGAELAVMRKADGSLRKHQTNNRIMRQCEGCEKEEKKEMPELQLKPLKFAGVGTGDSGAKIKTPLQVAENTIARKEVSGILNLKKESTTVRRRTDEDELIQSKENQNAGRGPPGGGFETQLNQSKGGGQPMDGATNSFMSSRFGVDFSGVRIHTGGSAANMSNAIHAKAFTHQNHIYFNQGQYQPGTHAGKTLLAHELTHTIQQGAVGSRVQTQLKVGSPDDPLEREADAMADQVMRKTLPVNGIRGPTHNNSALIQRQNECGPGVHRGWGGFSISGSCRFVQQVRNDLNQLNGTALGSRLLSWVSQNRRGAFFGPVRIQEYTGIPEYGIVSNEHRILYDPYWIPRSGCGYFTGWEGAPGYVYLFHEIVHFWLHEFKGYRSQHRDWECMASGLGSYFHSMNYNENKLRCELGLPIRPCYGSRCTTHSVPTCSGGRARTTGSGVQRKTGLNGHLQRTPDETPGYADSRTMPVFSVDRGIYGTWVTQAIERLSSPRVQGNTFAAVLLPALRMMNSSPIWVDEFGNQVGGREVSYTFPGAPPLTMNLSLILDDEATNGTLSGRFEHTANGGRLVVRIRNNQDIRSLTEVIYHESLHLVARIIRDSGTAIFSGVSAEALNSLNINRQLHFVRAIENQLEFIRRDVNRLRSPGNHIQPGQLNRLARYVADEVMVRVETDAFMILSGGVNPQSTPGIHMVDHYVFESGGLFNVSEIEGLGADGREARTEILDITRRFYNRRLAMRTGPERGERTRPGYQREGRRGQQQHVLDQVQQGSYRGPLGDRQEVQRQPLGGLISRKCASCEEEVQRKSWEKEEQYNPYHSVEIPVQRKALTTISQRGPPHIQRNIFSDAWNGAKQLASDAVDTAKEALNAGIDWIKKQVRDQAKKIKGYKALALVLEEDPITGTKVERNGRNFIEAGLEIIPNGDDYKKKLEKDGGLDKAAAWLDEQLKLIAFGPQDVLNDFSDFVSGLSLSDAKSPGAALQRGLNVFKKYINRVITFAVNVGVKFLEIVKDFALKALATWIKGKTKYYPLMTLVLGEDPLTGAEVAQDGKNILTTVILLQEDGQKQLTKMKENGALEKGAEWIDETIESLVEIMGSVRTAVSELWNGFKISHLLKPTETFGLIYDKLSKPLAKIGSFVVRVGSKILEIVRDIVVNELLTWIKTKTKWYPLLTVVLEEDPITKKKVERNGANLLTGFVNLHPEGEQQLAQMKESGSFQKAATWIDESIIRVAGIVNGIKNGFINLWKTFKVSDLLYPTETFKTIYDLFYVPISELISFAVEVAKMILKFIKDALIKRLVAFAKTIPGYHLVTVIMGKDIFSQEVVERSPENIIRGFMGLVPGGEEKFQELKQSGAIGEAVAWIEGAIEELNLTWEMIRGLFTKAWNEFSLKDLATPVETFKRVMDLFAEPIGRVVRFVGKVVLKLIEIALRLMGFPFELIGSIISRAQMAYEEIKNNPIRFLKNILKAVKQAFVQFFGNILTHLINGVGEWLFGQLGDAGITIPTDFSFQSILKLVFEILGITKEKIFEKIKKKVGPEKWAKIEGAMDKLTGIWTFVSDIMTRGPVAIWEKIQEKLTGLWDMVIGAARDWIMTKIVEQVSVKLLSMLDPTGIMAVVNSCIAFFKAVQSAIEYFIPMLEMLNSFLGGVVQIAQGNIKPAADLLESTMAKGMPILIGFLANQVGLGRIGSKIKEVIEKLQEKVDQGIQWIIDKAWAIGAKLLDGAKNMLGIGKDKGKDGKKTKGDLGIDVAFNDKGGEDHHLFFKKKGSRYNLMMASDKPEGLEKRVKDQQKITKKGTKEYGHLTTALTLIGALNTDMKKWFGGNTRAENADTTAHEAKIKKALEGTSPTDAKSIRYNVIEGGVDVDTNLPLSTITYVWNSHQPQTVHGNPLTKNPGNTSGGSPSNNNLLGTDFLNTFAEKSKNNDKEQLKYFRRFHLISDRYHGPGADWNLVWASETDNQNYLKKVEEKIDDYVHQKGSQTKDNQGVYYLNINVSYYSDDTKDYMSYFPTHLTLDFGALRKKDGAEGFTEKKPIAINGNRFNFADTKNRIPEKKANQTRQKIIVDEPESTLLSDVKLSSTNSKTLAYVRNNNLLASRTVPGLSAACSKVGTTRNSTIISILQDISGKLGKFDSRFMEISLFQKGDHKTVKGAINAEVTRLRAAPERTTTRTTLTPAEQEDRVLQLIKSSSAGPGIGNADIVRGIEGIGKDTVDKTVKRLEAAEKIEKVKRKWKVKGNVDGQPPQPKLKVGQPDDPLELEADRMADQVVNRKVIQRKCAACEKEEQVQRKCAKCSEEEEVQREEKSNGGGRTSTGFSQSLRASAGGGKPLKGSVRGFMENGFNADFSQVRIHTGGKAERLSEEINAKAFTHKNHIYFNQGQYQPETIEGKRLLAHELTHTIQQGAVGEKVMRSPDLDAYANPSDKSNDNKLTPDQIKLRDQIEAGKLGDTKGIIKGKKKLTPRPVNVKFFKGSSNRRMLVIGGVHGSERQGIYIANDLISKLQKTKVPVFYNIIVVPVLFPDNAAYGKFGKREFKKFAKNDKKKENNILATNRNFPLPGEYKSGVTKKDADGDPIFDENVMLLELIRIYQPEKIISLHGTQNKHKSGVFSDPYFINAIEQKRIDAMAEMAAQAAVLLFATSPALMPAAVLLTPYFKQVIRDELMDKRRKELGKKGEQDLLKALETAIEIDETIQKDKKAVKELAKRKGLKGKQKERPAVAGNDLSEIGYYNHLWNAKEDRGMWKGKRKKLNSKPECKLTKDEDKARKKAQKSPRQVLEIMQALSAGKTPVVKSFPGVDPADKDAFFKTLVAALTKERNCFLEVQEEIMIELESRKDKISLGKYAPGMDIGVFTVEPAVNRNVSDYDVRKKGKKEDGFINKDATVSEATRKAELQAYSQAIFDVLLKK